MHALYLPFVLFCVQDAACSPGGVDRHGALISALTRFSQTWKALDTQELLYEISLFYSTLGDILDDSFSPLSFWPVWPLCIATNSDLHLAQPGVSFSLTPFTT